MEVEEAMPDISGMKLAVPTELADSGPYILRTSSALAGELARLRGMLTRMEPTWESQSKDEYVEYKLLWDRSAEDLMGESGLLTHIGRTMNSVWTTYVGTEEANVKNWQHG